MIIETRGRLVVESILVDSGVLLHEIQMEIAILLVVHLKVHHPCLKDELGEPSILLEVLTNMWMVVVAAKMTPKGAIILALWVYFLKSNN